MFFPKTLKLQWHLSDRCNLRCTHCYQDSYKKEKYGLDDWYNIADQFVTMVNNYNARGHIDLTGGEPISIEGFKELAEYIVKSERVSIGCLTNGTLITEDIAKWFSSIGAAYVQVSIDGPLKIHDQIRGAGQFKAAMKGIKHLLNNNVYVSISFTAHKQNWRYYSDVIEIAKKLGVGYVWSDRMIPEGQGVEEFVMSPEETKEYFNLMRSGAIVDARETEVGMERAIQFLESKDYSKMYKCTAGEGVITIMPDGTLYPCRRLPIPSGNVYAESLEKLYQINLQPIRDNLDKPNKGCEGCAFENTCRGGLKCLSYSLTGDMNRADPGCYVAKHDPITKKKVFAIKAIL